MQYRVRIIQPIVPEYRKALFDGLAERFGDRIDIMAAEQLGSDVSVPLDCMRFEYSHPFKRLGPLFWQENVNLNGLARGDVLVVCGDLHHLSTMLLVVKARLRGVRIVWWGHYRTATSRGWRVRVRLAIAKMLADVMLCYTRKGAQCLVQDGFDNNSVFFTGNTINQEPIKQAIATYDGMDRFNGKPGILFCSVLREKVQLDLAIRALSDPRLRDVCLAVIGDGPERSRYQNLAREIGVDERIIWLGETRDQKAMAPWFLSARAFVYPGSVGLSILHSMSYGLPVIVHNNAEHQMPEFEVMEDGKTGLLFKEGDVGDLAEKIVTLIGDSALRKNMAEHSQNLAFEKYTMDSMVDNYSRAIEAAAAK